MSTTKELKSQYKITGGDINEQIEEAGEDAGSLQGEEQPHEEEVEEVKIPERKLHREEAAVRLQMLGKTEDGDRYGYLKVVCTGMNLTDISAITYFKQLLFVDVSDNKLTLEDLQVLTTMPYLIVIHADNNLIKSAALKRMEYLQVIIMNNNKIESCKDVYQPQLSTIELGNNMITKIEFEYDMPELKCIDFRNNLIKEVSGMCCAKLEALYLAGNKIKSLKGLESLTNLKILHLRNNPIKKLDGFASDLKKLTYVNFRNCKIGTLKQVKKMKVLSGLKILILKGTPYMGGTGEEDQEGGDEEDDNELRVEVLASVPTLQRINKTLVTSEEREEATELLKGWIEEPEEDLEEEQEEEVGEEIQGEDGPE